VSDSARQAHLGYCSNVHVGSSWGELKAAITGPIARVRRAFAPEGTMGIGLRISAAAAHELTEPGATALCAELLARESLEVFTINGFPFGPFHGEAIKESVYRPDWSEPDRGDYSDRLAHILAELAPDGLRRGSVSTVPGAFGPRAAQPGVRRAIEVELLDHAVELWQLAESTGRHVVLALEPEPSCMLETTADAIEFFEAGLLSREACGRVAAATGLDDRGAEALIRGHVGVCLDVCHAAVQFEDPNAAVDGLLAAGIQIAKTQLSAGLVVDPLDTDALRALQSLDEPVYLHQVVARRPDGTLESFLDLPDAFETAPRESGTEWRVHFHVPIFAKSLGPLGSTRPVLEAILDRQRERPFCDALEVETYTWHVLPEAIRPGDIESGIVRELEWARDRLGP
jgi:sugar phosphate isomerase/epimerase